MPGQEPRIGCALMRRTARLAAVFTATLLPAAPAAAELRVALLDTGVNAGHEVFEPRQLVGFWDFSQYRGLPKPGQTFHPGIEPYDPIGHGTATSALFVGHHRWPPATPSFAPGTKFAMAKVFSDGGGYWGQGGPAIRWAVDTIGADVINISIGSIIPTPGFRAIDTAYSAIDYARSKGVLVVVGNGNGILNTGEVPGHGPSSAYGQSPNVLAVGAAGERGAKVSYDPEVAAQYDANFPRHDSPNGYTGAGGTSVSSPLVAGFATRLLAEAEAHGRTLGVDQLETLVKRSARDTSQPPTFEGYGVIDAAQLPAALEHARAGTQPQRPAIDVDAAYVDIYQQAVRTVANNPPTR